MLPSTVNKILLASVSARQCRFQSSRILVGLSATQYGDRALEQALRLSREGDSVIGIFIPPGFDGTGLSTEICQEIQDQQTKRTQEVLSRANQVAAQAKGALKSTVKFETQTLKPSFDRRIAIVEACYRLKADVLVLGSKGAGSEETEKMPYDQQRYQQNYQAVANIPNYAMHYAPCPVLVVKPKATAK